MPRNKDAVAVEVEDDGAASCSRFVVARSLAPYQLLVCVWT